jgi:hypothetical protein
MHKTARRVVGAVLAFALLGLGLASLPGSASATTLTCTNTNNALVSPIGCGGLQFAYTAKGVQDVAAGGDFWNAHVTTALDSTSNPFEDFTVYALGGLTTDGPGGLGIYVAMYTPLGKVSGFKIDTLPAGYTGTDTVGEVLTNAYPVPGSTFSAEPNDYCLSTESADTGPHHAARWHVVLRTCSTNGIFTYGNDVTGTGHTLNSVSTSTANRFQLWAPVTGMSGLLFINDSLSHGFKAGNTPYVLDDPAFGGPGSWLLAYPENDGLNQEGSIIGCTQPVTLLDTSYANCP